VDQSGSELCPVIGFNVSCIHPSGSATGEFGSFNVNMSVEYSL